MPHLGSYLLTAAAGVVAYLAYKSYTNPYFFTGLSFVGKLVGASAKLNKLLLSKNEDDWVADKFEAMADAKPSKVAILFDDEKLTLRDIDNRANQWANWAISKGLKKGDVVALNMENCPDYFCFYMGMAKIGVISALINCNLIGESLKHCIDIAGAKFCVAAPVQAAACVEAGADTKVVCITKGHPANHVPKSVPMIDAEIDKTSKARPDKKLRAGCNLRSAMCYIYTSGTTGFPKASLIRGVRYLAGAFTFHQMFGTSDKDVVYVCMPLYHSAGNIIGVGSMITHGTTIAISRKFSARRYWDDCRKYNATIIQYIGELARYLLAQPPQANDKDNKVRLAIGNGMRPDVWEEFQSRFGIDKIGEFYAATEGAMAIFNEPGKTGAVGFVPGLIKPLYPVRICKFNVEEEELIRDPKTGLCIECGDNEVGQLMCQISTYPVNNYDGYVNNKKASDKKVASDVFKKGDKWFATGDLLVRDQYGFVYFSDRIGDTFRWKGENVSTNEVAEITNKWPQLQETNVFGVEVPGADGRAGMASVVLSDGETDLDVQGLYAHVAKNMPPYQRPQFIRLMPQMEITGTFKHRKVDLQKQGFNPELCEGNKLWYADHRKGAYIPITKEVFNKIKNHEIRV
eukprot:Clim_evm11s78 gene=Clim_evmTU11s78